MPQEACDRTSEKLLTALMFLVLGLAIFQAEIKQYLQSWSPPTCPRVGKDAASCSKITITTSLYGAWEQEEYNITFVRIENVVVVVGSYVKHAEAQTLQRLATKSFEIPEWASPDKKIIAQNHHLSTFTHCNLGICEVLLRPFRYYDILRMQVAWPGFPTNPPHKDRYAPLSIGSFTVAYIADDSPIIQPPLRNSI